MTKILGLDLNTHTIDIHSPEPYEVEELDDLLEAVEWAVEEPIVGLHGRQHKFGLEKNRMRSYQKTSKVIALTQFNRFVWRNP